MVYVRVSCFVVRGCGVSRRYKHVCNCNMFSVVNVYLGHLKFCAVCTHARRYICCSECNVVFNECNEPTSCLSARTVVKLCTLGVVALGVRLVYLTFTTGYVPLCSVCSRVVVFGLSVVVWSSLVCL